MAPLRWSQVLIVLCAAITCVLVLRVWATRISDDSKKPASHEAFVAPATSTEISAPLSDGRLSLSRCFASAQAPCLGNIHQVSGSSNNSAKWQACYMRMEDVALEGKCEDAGLFEDNPMILNAVRARNMDVYTGSNVDVCYLLVDREAASLSNIQKLDAAMQQRVPACGVVKAAASSTTARGYTGVALGVAAPPDAVSTTREQSYTACVDRCTRNSNCTSVFYTSSGQMCSLYSLRQPRATHAVNAHGITANKPSDGATELDENGDVDDINFEAYLSGREVRLEERAMLQVSDEAAHTSAGACAAACTQKDVCAAFYYNPNEPVRSNKCKLSRIKYTSPPNSVVYRPGTHPGALAANRIKATCSATLLLANQATAWRDRRFTDVRRNELATLSNTEACASGSSLEEGCVKVLDHANLAGCAQACADHPACEAMTWSPGTSNNCRLGPRDYSTSSPVPQRKFGAVSANKLPRFTSHLYSDIRYDQVAAIHSDNLLASNSNVASADLCALECDRARTCASFFYDAENSRCTLSMSKYGENRNVFPVVGKASLGSTAANKRQCEHVENPMPDVFDTFAEGGVNNKSASMRTIINVSGLQMCMSACAEDEWCKSMHYAAVDQMSGRCTHYSARIGTASNASVVPVNGRGHRANKKFNQAYNPLPESLGAPMTGVRIARGRATSHVTARECLQSCAAENSCLSVSFSESTYDNVSTGGRTACWQHSEPTLNTQVTVDPLGLTYNKLRTAQSNSPGQWLRLDAAGGQTSTEVANADTILSMEGCIAKCTAQQTCQLVTYHPNTATCELTSLTRPSGETPGQNQVFIRHQEVWDTGTPDYYSVGQVGTTLGQTESVSIPGGPWQPESPETAKAMAEAQMPNDADIVTWNESSRVVSVWRLKTPPGGTSATTWMKRSTVAPAQTVTPYNTQFTVNVVLENEGANIRVRWSGGNRQYTNVFIVLLQEVSSAPIDYNIYALYRVSINENDNSFLLPRPLKALTDSNKDNSYRSYCGCHVYVWPTVEDALPVGIHGVGRLSYQQQGQQFRYGDVVKVVIPEGPNITLPNPPNWRASSMPLPTVSVFGELDGTRPCYQITMDTTGLDAMYTFMHIRIRTACDHVYRGDTYPVPQDTWWSQPSIPILPHLKLEYVWLSSMFGLYEITLRPGVNGRYDDSRDRTLTTRIPDAERDGFDCTKTDDQLRSMHYGPHQ